MADIEVYRVKMDLSGELTQIPDSQKLFGALIYMYAEYTNDDTASGFVSKIKEKKIYFALSDLLPDNYLPIPQTFLLDELAISIQSNEKTALYRKRTFYESGPEKRRGRKCISIYSDPGFPADTCVYRQSELWISRFRPQCIFGSADQSCED